MSQAEPTRLFIDAKSTDEWHTRGFFPVLSDPATEGSRALLLSMLQLGRAQQFTPGEKLPDAVHTSVAFMFGEEGRLTPADDTLNIAAGYRGSYPNFFFDVAVEDIESFARSLTAVQNGLDFEKFAARWGVRRSSRRLWSTFDWLHENFRRRDATEFGLLDLNRYKNL